MLGWFKNYKATCLVCGKGVDPEKASVVNYRYRGDDGETEIGEAFLCEKHVEELEKRAKETDEYLNTL